MNVFLRGIFNIHSDGKVNIPTLEHRNGYYTITTTNINISRTLSHPPPTLHSAHPQKIIQPLLLHSLVSLSLCQLKQYSENTNNLFVTNTHTRNTTTSLNEPCLLLQHGARKAACRVTIIICCHSFSAITYTTNVGNVRFLFFIK